MKNPGIYILTSPSRKQYVGKDSNLPNRTKEHLRGNSPECRAIHDAIQKYGREAFSVEIIRYPRISQEALNAVERWWVRRLQTLAPSGYNLTEGGDGIIPSEETRKKMSENASKRVADGTHHLLGGEIQRRANKKRVEKGTHHWLGENNPNHKRVVDGTHHLLGDKNPVHKRVADGTHHLLGGEIQRRTVKKQLEEGTHNFLDSDFQRQVQKKRIEEGTHNLLSGEIQRRSNKKRLENGTHHFLGDSNPSTRLSKEGRHPRTLKRQKAEWCYIIALSRFWYEIHDYTLKRRAEFLSKDIPDMSNAEQEYLF